jgi:glycosyltransferase involved in cell wall biosynthesis
MIRRVAVVSPFPNAPYTAEAEWIRRFTMTSERLGFESIEVTTSDDITRCSPDCVLVTHEVSPKLTEFPTLGLHWNPPDFFAQDPLRRKAVLSLDGHLCGSRQIAEWIDDFCTSHGKRAVIHDGLVLPSTPDIGPAGCLPSEPTIMYIGIRWDGSRHGDVFRGLEGRVPLRLYGPPDAWAGHDEYRGALPFDGVSVIAALRESGIALCLHKYAHRQANCPTMRLLEAAAAGALIITDDFEFPRYWFRNSVLYVDAELPAERVVRQIITHVEWARSNPVTASRLAKRSNELFRRHLTLENMLRSLPEFVDQVRQRRSMVLVKKPEEALQPVVEYIVRVGSRPAETVARALASLAAQTYQEIAVLLVQFHPVPELDAVVDKFRSRFRWIRRIVVSNNGTRSTAWWAGLNALTADFFGVLDDDDTLLSNHVASLMDRFRSDSDYGLVYSGLIKQEDEPGHYVQAPQFEGPLGKVIEERREIHALAEADFSNFLPTSNVIGNHTWICRRSLLDGELLSDPKIEWAEDVYFLGLVAGRTKFAFTAMATAVWHWRSTTKDNWTLSYPKEALGVFLARWQERLQHVKLPSYNRVPVSDGRYDFYEAVIRDAPRPIDRTKELPIVEDETVSGDPLPGDFLIHGHLRDGATKRDGHLPATPQESVSIDSYDGRQTALSAITDAIIDTTSISYCYSVMLSANPSVVRGLRPASMVTVLVAIEVISGKVGIVWIGDDLTHLESAERYVTAAPGIQRVAVSVPAENVHHLVVRNFAGDSTSSSFRLIGFRAVN